MANWMEQVDQQLAAFLADWSILTTFLALTIVAIFIFPLVFTQDPDTHPLLLARQASASPVRNRNESAKYRAPETPHGYPLKSGLNVKDAETPGYAQGKDGDLRDIWREVSKSGSPGPDGRIIPTGKILTVLGKEEVVEHDIRQLNKEIQIIGKHLQASGCRKVALYLPNSVEYLLGVFACSFYGISPVLLPYNLPHPKVYEMLNAAGADGLICAAGNLPLEDVAKSCQGLKLLTWVVEKTSRHMDWNGVPDSAAKRLKVSVWHDVVEGSQGAAFPDVLQNGSIDAPDLISAWQPKPADAKPEIVTFTQRSLAAAVSALISALPPRQRLAPNDLVLPASSFNINYVLCMTLASLYSHTSLAITSVAEPGVDFDLATRSVSPTIVIASAETMARLHAKESTQQVSIPQKLDQYSSSKALLAGRMPTSGLLFGLLAPPTRSSGNAPGRLRLVLTAERLGAGTPALSSGMLSDLRIFTRARIGYALTSARVAGAIAQSNVFDYRRDSETGHSHFGIPLSSVEVKLTNQDDTKLASSQPQGELVVSGPAVSGGETKTGMKAMIREDGTLAFASKDEHFRNRVEHHLTLKNPPRLTKPRKVEEDEELLLRPSLQSFRFVLKSNLHCSFKLAARVVEGLVYGANSEIVGIDAVRESNARGKEIGPGLVAVFVGGTGGIGESTAKELFLRTTRPKAYIIGRNETRGQALVEELQRLNPDGEAIFIQKDISLLRNVDELAEDLKQRETKINCLFLTAGFMALRGRKETDEGLDRKMCVNYYARVRCTLALMPLLQAASDARQLSRVITVLAAGSEGEVRVDDLDLRRNFTLQACLAHCVVMSDFMVEELAQRYPGTSFSHSYPGTVKTGIANELTGPVRLAVKILYAVMTPWILNVQESGERHFFQMTSRCYPAKKTSSSSSPDNDNDNEDDNIQDVGIPCPANLGPITGMDGVAGSGAYLLDWDGKATGDMSVLQQYRDQDMRAKVWAHTQEMFAQADRLNEIRRRRKRSADEEAEGARRDAPDPPGWRPA